jgi:PAS domain S-box-containing protein
MNKLRKSTESAPPQDTALRERAEAMARDRAAQSPEDLKALSPEEIRQTLHDLRVHQFELGLQNEELRRTQVELDTTRTHYLNLYDLAPVGYVTLSEKGLLLEANLTTAALLGVSRGALVKQPITRFILPEDQDIYYLHRKKLFETGQPQACELRMVKMDGTAFWAHIAATVAQDADGTHVCRIVLSDITARKIREDARELRARLFVLLTTPGDFRERILALTASLQSWSGCEAVGIRLRAGDDYPYYETRGFPPAFVQAENQLCAYGPDGKILRDGADNPVLECMCGNILCGRFDPAKPFFTAHGSFWSNNTTALLASTTVADCLALTRNRCNGEGYESVALIPLRAGHQIFGLLQFNDHRPDRFTPGLVAHFERMADSLAIALSRRQAEEALRESEERHRRIIESSSDGFLLRSKEIIIYANPAALKLFRANHPGDLIGKRYLDLVHPDDRALTAERVKKAIDENWVAPPREHRILALDGQVVHVESIGGLIKHRGENQIFGIFRDITERTRTKAALRKSEERYQRITEAITDYIYTVRVADGRAAQTTHGPGCLAVTGYRAKEYAEDPFLWVRMVAAEDRSGVEEQARRILSGEDAPPIEHRIVHKNGTLRWVRNTFVPLRDEHGVLVSYDGLIQDITERKRAEVALEEESRRRTVLLDNIPGCLALILKKDTREIVASNKLARELGAVPGQTCFKTCAMRDDNCPFCLAPTMWATGQLQRIEVEYRGTWYEEIWAPLSENLYVHYIFDISERKGAEAQNRQLQKAESLGRMAGAIAHHFNNQLGAVMGNLELAMVGLPRGAGAVEKLTEAMQAARRAAEVSGLMLTYLGQTRGKREPLDLSETCRQSLPMLQAALPQDVALKTDLPSPGPSINANANQIQQVLTSLCTNAWEAVGDGRGVVHLIVKVVSAADIPAAPRFPFDWQSHDTAYACLEVADAGCGIATPDIEKLFDPFYSTKFAGRGLGLSVALGIVRTHGGVITVQSAPGHGSVFRIFFPVSTEAVPRPPEKAAGAPEAERGGTVLLVEDLDMLRNMAKSMLELLGFSVLEARDGVEALEVFRPRQCEIRFVLCDLTMPRMDGWETLAALRELAPGIPVILSSGHNESRVMDGDHPTLPEAFLSKPYGFKELRDVIARALANKK